MKLELSLYAIGVMGFYHKMNVLTKPIIIISLIRGNVYRFNMGRSIGLMRAARYIKMCHLFKGTDLFFATDGALSKGRIFF